MQALSKTLTTDELLYLKEQFALLEPNKNGNIALDNISVVGSLQIILIYYSYESLFGRHSFFFLFGQSLKKNATNAMNEANVYDFLASVCISTTL